MKDLREDVELNKDVIDKDDYADAQDVLGMLGENLQNVEQYGKNTTRILKAMEELLKDRTGGYTDMDLLPVLQQTHRHARSSMLSWVLHRVRTVSQYPHYSFAC